MMKHEFDALVGIETTPEAYERIEACYMYYDNLFPTKESVAAYYKKHDLNFFENLYKDMLDKQKTA